MKKYIKPSVEIIVIRELGPMLSNSLDGGMKVIDDESRDAEEFEAKGNTWGTSNGVRNFNAWED